MERYTTVWDDYFNRQSPSDESNLLTKEQVLVLPFGSHIMIWDYNDIGPSEYEVRESCGEVILVDVYSNDHWTVEYLLGDIRNKAWRVK